MLQDDEFVSQNHPEFFEAEAESVRYQTARPREDNNVGPSEKTMVRLRELDECLADDECADDGCIDALREFAPLIFGRAPVGIPDHPETPVLVELRGLRERIRSRVLDTIARWHFVQDDPHFPELARDARKRLDQISQALLTEHRGRRVSQGARRDDEICCFYFQVLFRLRQAMKLLPAFPWPRSTQLEKIQAVAYCCALPWPVLAELVPHRDDSKEVQHAVYHSPEEAARIAVAREYGITTQTLQNLVSEMRRRIK